jgi:hypothetical protein
MGNQRLARQVRQVKSHGIPCRALVISEVCHGQAKGSMTHGRRNWLTSTSVLRTGRMEISYACCVDRLEIPSGQPAPGVIEIGRPTGKTQSGKSRVTSISRSAFMFPSRHQEVRCLESLTSSPRMPACCRPTSLDDPTSRDQIQRTFSCRHWNLPPTTPTWRATSEPHEQLQWHRSGGIQS